MSEHTLESVDLRNRFDSESESVVSWYEAVCSCGWTTTDEWSSTHRAEESWEQHAKRCAR